MTPARVGLFFRQKSPSMRADSLSLWGEERFSQVV